ncbi:ABC transporter permease [Saccharopolyspora karakumensis]|uniref:ABC transporter permease n=1 Tax=Saccharopolyspora karakumensis TaxID=2530386 RepID=A0A4R5B6K1_9PSEU|nr:ABC transporter permease [Saccharopolyspora karakumensis]TDD81491.1 ABC transporter permease [Saccharopolyspora karakumensis]
MVALAGNRPFEAGTGLRAGARYLLTPIVLGAVLVTLYAYVSAQPLDLIEQRSLNADYVLSRTWKHLVLTGIVTVFILGFSIPAGVLLTRPWARRLAAPILAVANIGQAVPSLGLIVLLAVTFVTLGVNQIAVIAFVLYGLLPVLRNTIAGLQQVDRSVIESARGMGMTRTAVLWTIELPLAVPVMLAGIRTALVITVGTVALATFIGAGGLGDVISNGINSSRNLVLVTGSVLVAVLALLVDWLAGIAEKALHPRGL